MNDEIFTAKLVLTGLIAAGTALWGWFGWLVLLWVASMVLDYATGTLAALKRHDWSSAEARGGLWHKCGMIVSVLVAALTDIALSLILRVGVIALPFDYSVLLTALVLSWYTLTELGSTLENATKLSEREIPWLSQLLRVAAHAAEAAGNSVAGKEDGHDD